MLIIDCVQIDVEWKMMEMSDSSSFEKGFNQIKNARLKKRVKPDWKTHCGNFVNILESLWISLKEGNDDKFMNLIYCHC